MRFPIPFTKMSGSGNDFIIIDHRKPFLTDPASLAKAICRRKFSVGADGLILIEPSDRVDFSWRFYNADGSSAAMCGNGARCAARFAHEKGIAKGSMRFTTGAGDIEAWITGSGVKIRLPSPSDIVLDRFVMVDEQELIIHSINTGVPHAVCFINDLAACTVKRWGRMIRNHPLFQPAGTNMNFVKVLDINAMYVRTYERGVEDETQACGTGAVASALIASLLGKVESPVTMITSGGERLFIHFVREGEGFSAVFLEGASALVYEGQLTREALEYPFKGNLSPVEL